jgi:hypothetical protein
MKRIVSAVGGFAALVAIGVIAAGCGQERRDAVGQAEPAGDVVVAQPASAGQAAAPATSPAGGSGWDAEARLSADALPPDVAAVVADPNVQRGQVVELFAFGSEDVTDIVLGDDRGEKQPFSYDPSAKRWHTLYRVPLKSKGEKLALSVTARTESQRWRRVWLFLTPHDDGVVEATGTSGEPGPVDEPEATPADSVSPREQ